MLNFQFLEPNTQMPLTGLICYINAENSVCKCLLQYRKRDKFIWTYKLNLPYELVTDSMRQLKSEIGLYRLIPLSAKARQWVLGQPIHVPLYIQFMNFMHFTYIRLN